jgi:hypothetical protein
VRKSLGKSSPITCPSSERCVLDELIAGDVFRSRAQPDALALENVADRRYSAGAPIYGGICQTMDECSIPGCPTPDDKDRETRPRRVNAHEAKERRKGNDPQISTKDSTDPPGHGGGGGAGASGRTGTGDVL